MFNNNNRYKKVKPIEIVEKVCGRALVPKNGFINFNVQLKFKEFFRCPVRYKFNG